MRSKIIVFAVVFACGGDSPSPAIDGGGGGADAGALPETPVDTWTWVEIPGSSCANGSPAGFGINRSAISPDLYVYFAGGGACWDAETCFVAKTSVHIEDTYTAATLAAEGISGMVSREPTTPPLFAATAVYVPYCTGDLHAGAQSRDYVVDGQTRSVAHVGGANTQIFVDALRASFPDAETVWLAGSSAGGFGATLNHHRFAEAYSAAVVHVLQDGAPFVPVLSDYETWQAAWQLQFPPACDGCDASLPAVMDIVGAAHPSSRIGLLHYDDDAVIKAYFGYAADPGSMVAATDALIEDQYDLANTKAFVLAGQGHTMLGQAGNLVGPGGVRLIDWFTQWADGDPAWATVR